jgi:hypothetical protein
MSASEPPMGSRMSAFAEPHRLAVGPAGGSYA